MSKYITTMSNDQITTFGEKLFNSWDKFSTTDELIVFLDNPDTVTIEYKNITFKKIKNPNYTSFLEKYKGNPENRGTYKNGYEYRFDVVKFSHKVYAFYEGLKYVNKDDKYFVWWDADAWLTGTLNDQILEEKLGIDKGFCAYLGRKDWDHSETGFIAFNTNDSDYKLFLDSMVKIYDAGNVFKLAQGRTDSHVFDLLREAFVKQKNKTFLNISEGVNGNHVWPDTSLYDFSDHAKGPILKNKLLEDQLEAPMINPTFGQPINYNANNLMNNLMSRYDQIYKLIEYSKPKIISEIGVAQGERAISMINHAFKFSDKVVYFGFDVFEDGGEALNQKEMNAKKVSSYDEVYNRLVNLQEKFPNLYFKLIKGNTNETLPKTIDQIFELTSKNNLTINVKPIQSEFVFIDGGHSVETIKNDYSAFKNSNLVLLDDYYVMDNGVGPDITKFGCNFLEKEPEHTVLLPKADPIKGGGFTKILLAGKNASKVKVNEKSQTNPSTLDNTQNKQKKQQATETALSTGAGKGVKIETRNSIPNETLQAQVDYACQMMKKHNISEVLPAKLHEKWAYLIGGAKSYQKPEYFSKIKSASLNNGMIFSSKTAHDYLISQNIVPWACLLLDPRPHVADYFEIHPDVTYFVASQCHQAVFDKLISKNAKMFVYHAEVAAGEKEIVKKHFPEGKMLPGGSTSQSRGISILMYMGFYKFKLFGLDSSYPEKPEQVHGINQQKKPLEISINNNKTKERITEQKFWTDPELLAQINDMEHIIKIYSHLEFDCQSDGLMKSMLDFWHKDKRNFNETYEV